MFKNCVFSSSDMVRQVVKRVENMETCLRCDGGEDGVFWSATRGLTMLARSGHYSVQRRVNIHTDENGCPEGFNAVAAEFQIRYFHL